MKLNQHTSLHIIGYFHALALFWSFYPAAVLLLKPEGTAAGAFCLTGLILLFPIVLSRTAVRGIKSLPLYLLASLTATILFGSLNGLIDSHLGIGFRPGFIFSSVLCLLLFLIRGYSRIKKGRLQKMLLELPSANLEQADYSQLEASVFLEEPHPAQWVFFALQYVAGAFLKSSLYWHMIFYLFLGDVFLCFAWRFLDSFYSFLQGHSHSANLPVKTMKKIVNILFGIACLILTLFALPSLLYGREPLSGITFREPDSSYSIEEEFPELFAPGPDMSDLSDLLPSEEDAPPPKWLIYLSNALFYLFCAGFVLLLLYAVYRICRNAGSFFASETEDEIQFLENSFSDQNRRLRRKNPASAAELPVNLRIRKLYKRTIRRNLKNPPAGSETPAELERSADLAPGESSQFLHNCYEKARYSKEGCTPEDAALLKKNSI